MRRAILNFIRKLLGLAEEEIIANPIKDIADKITPLENNLEHSGTRRIEKPCLEDYIEIAKEKFASINALEFYGNNSFSVEFKYDFSDYRQGVKEVTIYLYYNCDYNIRSVYGTNGLLICRLNSSDSEEILAEKWEHFNEEAEMARRKIKLYYLL